MDIIIPGSSVVIVNPPVTGKCFFSIEPVNGKWVDSKC